MKEHLGGMTAINQWFVWLLQWNPTDAKYEKRPWSVATSEVMDAQSPANWMSFDLCDQWVRHLRAHTSAPGITYTHGFMFTKGCGYWFFDADSAIENGQYTGDIHNTLLTHMPGAAFELSSSGRGYHLFGRGNLIDHASRVPSGVRKMYPAIRDLELYSERRGVAFGLSGQFSGNADTDHSAFINSWLVPTLFPKSAEDVAADPSSYGDAPQDPRWIGPQDDDDLLRRAMASGSVQSKLGHASTFQQLWESDPVNQKYYAGESEIDQALISHFAFWTGRNPARTERLMLRSPRKREKWDERRGNFTWLQHSILEQFKHATNVCIDHVEPAPAEKAPVNEVTAAVDNGKAHFEGSFIDYQGLATYFKGCVYVTEDHAVFTPGPNNTFSLLRPEQFEAIMSEGRTFVVGKDNESTTRKAWDAFVKNTAINPPKVDATCMRPDLATGEIIQDENSDKRMINIWRAPFVKRVAGDATWFTDLIARLLPDQRDQRILLSYMAALVQNPGVKFRWCPVMQGTKGNGKSTVADILSNAVGRNAVSSPTNDQLVGKFNGWQLGKMLARVDDGEVNDRAMLKLRPMITDPWLNIESKGKEIRTVRTFMNFFFTMNALDGIHRDDDERRFAIFFTAQQNEKDVHNWFPSQYFANLHDWLNNYDGYAICANFLMSYQVDPEFNPVVIGRAPVTSSEDRVRSVNRTPLMVVLEDNINEGMPGTKEGWLSISAVKRIALAARLHIARHEMMGAVEKLGYRRIEWLGQHSRLQKNVMVDENTRPILYALENHPVHSQQYSPSQIADWYSRDQSQFVGGGVLLPQA